MFKAIFAPKESIKEAKKKKNLGNTMVTLLVASIMLALAVLVNLLGIFVSDAQKIAYTVIGVLIGAFVLFLFLGWLFKLTMNIFAKKVTYYDALTPLVKGLLVLTTGVLLSALLNLIPVVGIFLGILATMILLILTFSVTIKTAMELTGMDILTTLIGLVIVLIPFFVVLSAFMQIMTSTGLAL